MDYNEFNYQLEQLKSKIYKFLEDSKLPLGAIFYLLKDIYNNLQNQYIATVNSYSMTKLSDQSVHQLNLNQNNKSQESKQSQVE